MSAAWQSTADGKWDCRIARIEPYHGVLIVTLIKTGEVVHQESVGIAYDAKFGPDIEDVHRWTERCLDVIDHPNARSLDD